MIRIGRPPRAARRWIDWLIDAAVQAGTRLRPRTHRHQHLREGSVGLVSTNDCTVCGRAILDRF